MIARSTPDVEKDVNEIRLQTPGSRRTSPQSLLEMATSSSSLSVSRARSATFSARTSSFIIITRCNLLSRHGNPRSTTSPRDRTNKKKHKKKKRKSRKQSITKTTALLTRTETKNSDPGSDGRPISAKINHGISPVAERRIRTYSIKKNVHMYVYTCLYICIYIYTDI